MTTLSPPLPQMARYMEISARIYEVYLKYIAPEDMHVYSIDEVFMDVTGYLKTYKMSSKELAMKIILDVLKTTGITATRRDRAEPLSLQGCHGHRSETHPAGQKRRADRGAG